MKKSIISGVLALTVFLGVSQTIATPVAHAQNISIQQLIQLFISLGIIPSDKVAMVEAAFGMANTTGTTVTNTTTTNTNPNMSGGCGSSGCAFPNGTQSSSIPVTLKVSTQYSGGNSSAFITATIAGYSQNKNVSYWTLSISCPSGVTMPGKSGNELCGTTLTAYSNNMYDPTQDYTFLTTGVANNTSSAQVVGLTLTAYNSQGQSIGSDNESVQLSSSQTVTTSTQPSITIINPQAGGSFSNGAKANIATIQWSEQNGNYPVDIYLLNQNNQVVRNIVQDAPNTGSYVWANDSTLPNGTYQIEIDLTSIKGNTMISAYSGYFTVASQTTTTQTIGVTFTASPTSGVSPLQVTFTGMIDSKAYGPGPFTIDFGDGLQKSFPMIGLIGNVGNSQNTITPEVYTYSSPGIYTAKLSNDNCAGSGTGRLQQPSCSPGNAISTVTITVN